VLIPVRRGSQVEGGLGALPSNTKPSPFDEQDILVQNTLFLIHRRGPISEGGMLVSLIYDSRDLPSFSISPFLLLAYTVEWRVDNDDGGDN